MGWEEVNDKLGAMQSDFAYAGSQRPPKPADIDAVEKRLGVRFPAEYRDLMARFAAFTVEAKPEHWPAPKLYDIGPAWTFSRGFALLGFGEGVPPFLDIVHATEELRSKSGSKLVPFFRVSGSADRTCFKPDGRIVEWRHDEEGLHPSEHDTVYDVLLSHLEQLEENMTRMKQMRAKGGAQSKAAPIVETKSAPKTKAAANAKPTARKKPTVKAKAAKKPTKTAAKKTPTAKTKAAKKPAKPVAKRTRRG